MKAPLPGGGSRAFTVLEMTMAMALALGIAGSLIALLQQQVSFTRTLAQFAFLRDEAPQISTLLTGIVSKSDSYRVHSHLAGAMAMSDAVQSNGRALRLRFRNPDGTTDHAIVAFEESGGGARLNYYFRRHSDNSWPAEPSWVLSAKPVLVDFSNANGILEIRINGPAGEEITYSGNPI